MAVAGLSKRQRIDSDQAKRIFDARPCCPCCKQTADETKHSNMRVNAKHIMRRHTEELRLTNSTKFKLHLNKVTRIFETQRNALGPDWNFLNKTLHPDKLKVRAVSQVVDRHRAERSKLPVHEAQWQAPGAAGGFAADSDSEDGDAADATGVLDDNEDFGETGTHAELSTFEVETILKYRCKRMKRRDE
ncbi:hypothetical protein T492DRAFT_871496 [Pavlovales sp. CCMP2436]|nr:hypothetical protein T492DRAFT_871496 [Pavlovales sp. CCMP2436]